jgi:outer membrane protein
MAPQEFICGDNTMKKYVVAMSLAAAVAAPAVAAELAYQPGQWVLRGGLTQVEPREDSDNIKANGSAIPAKVGIDSDIQLGITVEYMFDANWGVEVLAATPFEHTASGRGALAGIDIADFKHLPPTVSAVYHFTTDSAFQPYAGVGVNYTFIYDEELTSEFEAAVGTGGDMKLDDSMGLAVQFGADYHIDEKWLLNASVRWIDIDTKAKITVPPQGGLGGGSRTVYTTDITVDPYVYTLSIGYKF